MFPKKFRRILRKILHVILLTLLKMCNNYRDQEKPSSTYKFRAFNFEVLNPNSRKPFSRSGHRIGADSSNFYSFGGYNPLVRTEEQNGIDEENELYVNSYPLFKELWKFNYATKIWKKVPISHTLPKELASNALILHKNMLMVYGGTGSPFGVRCSNHLYVCKVGEQVSEMVKVVTGGHKPPALYGQAIFIHNDYLYTIGGTSGWTYTCDIHRLDLDSLTWEAVYVRGTSSGGGQPHDPPGRYRHEIGCDGRALYVLGGGTAEESFGFADVPCFDLEKRCWYERRTVPDGDRGVPSPRRCHGAVQIETSSGPQVFIVGGHDGENIFDDLWRLDLTTFRWTSFPRCRLPWPTYFHAAAASPSGRLFVFGGIRTGPEEDGGGPEGTRVRRSSDVCAAWLAVPPLADIAWEALLHYQPDIVRCSKNMLIKGGLPRSYVQRIDNNEPSETS